jgi:hypothetical protein
MTSHRKSRRFARHWHVRLSGEDLSILDIPLSPSEFSHLKHTQSQIQTCKSLAATKPPVAHGSALIRQGGFGHGISSWEKMKVSNPKFGELNRPLRMGTFGRRKVPSENYDVKDKRVLIGFGGFAIDFSNFCHLAALVLWF